MFKMLVIALAAVALSGCDFSDKGSFELVQAGKQTYLLNKSNGQLQVVDGAIIAPTTIAAGETSAPKAKMWPVQEAPQLDGLKVAVKTTYRDGQMLYWVFASSVGERVKNAFNNAYASPQLNLDFDDKDGFRVVSLAAAMRGENGGARTLDDNGETKSFEWKGRIPLSRAAYDSLDTLELGWRGIATSKTP